MNLSSSRNSRKLKPREYYKVYSFSGTILVPNETFRIHNYFIYGTQLVIPTRVSPNLRYRLPKQNYKDNNFTILSYNVPKMKGWKVADTSFLLQWTISFARITKTVGYIYQFMTICIISFQIPYSHAIGLNLVRDQQPKT